MRRISFPDLAREPFRIFFPAGVHAGIVGVSLWPLYFMHMIEFYPGLDHARIMAYGLFGMATRISGDFWPKILASHYIYGALIWIAGVLLWAVYVLPKVLFVETED